MAQGGGGNAAAGGVRCPSLVATVPLAGAGAGKDRGCLGPREATLGRQPPTPIPAHILVAPIFRIGFQFPFGEVESATVGVSSTTPIRLSHTAQRVPGWLVLGKEDNTQSDVGVTVPLGHACLGHQRSPRRALMPQAPGGVGG